MTYVTLPNSIYQIPDKMFYDCINLEDVKFGNNITEIGENAFAECNFKSLIIPDTVKVFGKYVFFKCISLKRIKFGKGINVISEHAFSECRKIIELNFPDNIITIDDSAFFSCENILTINLSKNIKNINSNAFYLCISLNCIYFYGENEPNYIADNAFLGIETKRVFVPKSYTGKKFGALSVKKGFEECDEDTPAENSNTTLIVIITVFSIVVVIVIVVIVIVVVRINKNRKAKWFDEKLKNVLIDNDEYQFEDL